MPVTFSEWLATWSQIWVVLRDVRFGSLVAGRCAAQRMSAYERKADVFMGRFFYPQRSANGPQPDRRDATGLVLGNDRFRLEVEKLTGRRHLKSGLRPATPD